MGASAVSWTTLPQCRSGPNEAFRPMISPDFVLRNGESVRVFSKTGLILQPLLCCERVGFGPIHANQQFRVFATLLLLLEPQQPDRVHVYDALTAHCQWPCRGRCGS